MLFTNVSMLLLTLCCHHQVISDDTSDISRFPFSSTGSKYATLLAAYRIWRPGNILYSDEESYLRTTDGYNTVIVANGSTYLDWPRGCFGFHQINERYVLASESNSYCILLVDRHTSQMETFAGNCTCFGSENGRNGPLKTPTSIIPDSQSPEKVIIADTYDNALRHLNINSQILESFFRPTQLDDAMTSFRPFGLTQDSQTGNLFVLGSNSVYGLNYHEKYLKWLGATASYVDDLQCTPLSCAMVYVATLVFMSLRAWNGYFPIYLHAKCFGERCHPPRVASINIIQL